MPEMLKLKKAFGQNFIKSDEVISDILKSLDAEKDDFVIEIGPGGGALTIPLSEEVGRLVAIEIDKRLVKLLEEEFKNKGNVRIISRDILEADLKQILEDENAREYKRLKIAGNIPYNITSPIITKVLESNIAFENFTLMIQKEVAERICALPGTKKRGYMSALVQYYTEPSYIRTVDRDLFYPVPNVDSAVVNLDFRKKPPVDCDRDKFFNIVKQSFSHKRKTLANNLLGYIAPSKSETEELLHGIGIDPKRRAETLSLEEFAKIANLEVIKSAPLKKAAVDESELS